jgi:S-DNA-T family DNA segregation ATPase FtsK/SpoIIIE
VMIGSDVSGQGQAQAVQRLGDRIREAERAAAMPSIRPFRIDALPKDLDLDTALTLEDAPALRPMFAVTGLGGDETALQGVDLGSESPTFIVAGPSRSGRSTMLTVMARTLLAGGTDLVIATPRPSPLRALEGLPGVRAVLTGDDITEEDLRPHLEPDGVPVVFVVDDGELLIDAPAKTYLRTFVRTAADNQRALVLGGNTTGLAAGFGGWQVDAKKNRRGALLSPPDTVVGDLVGVRIPRTSISSRVVPGSALVHLGTGIATALQVPLVPEATTTGTQRVAGAATVLAS